MRAIAMDSAGEAVKNKKKNKDAFQVILDQLLGFRIASFSGNVTSISLGGTASDVLLRSAVTEMLYGSLGFLCFGISLVWDYAANKTEEYTGKDIMRSHYNGKKLSFFVSYILSIIGSALVISQLGLPLASSSDSENAVLNATLVGDAPQATRNVYALEFAIGVLGLSAYLSGIDPAKMMEVAGKIMAKENSLGGTVVSPSTVDMQNVNGLGGRDPFYHGATGAAVVPRFEFRDSQNGSVDHERIDENRRGAAVGMFPAEAASRESDVPRTPQLQPRGMER